MAPRLWLVSFGKFTFDGSFGTHTKKLVDFRPLQGDRWSAQQVAFSPNGKLLAYASSSIVRLWSVEERKIKYDFEGPTMDFFITFSRDSTLVVCGKETGLVRVLNTETGEVKNEMQLELAKSTRLECSSDGSLVAAALQNGSIGLWDTEKGERKNVFPCMWNATSCSIKLSSNGEMMAVVRYDECTILRNTGNEYQERMFSDGLRSHVFFSPNNQFMALANEEEILLGDKAWFGDKHGQASKRIPIISFTFDTRLVFSRNSKLVAIFCFDYDHEIRLCGTGQGEEMRVLKGHSGRLISVAFSPISPLLVSASLDHTVILWDTEKGEKLCTLIAHSDSVMQVAFSPNGEFVATASRDGIVGLWNVSRWKNRKDQE